MLEGLRDKFHLSLRLQTEGAQALQGTVLRRITLLEETSAGQLWVGCISRETQFLNSRLVHHRFLDTRFEQGQILDCVFEDCHFDRVWFQRTELRGTRFLRCSFVQFDLDPAQLREVTFEECVFVDAPTLGIDRDPERFRLCRMHRTTPASAAAMSPASSPVPAVIRPAVPKAELQPVSTPAEKAPTPAAPTGRFGNLEL